MSKGDALDRLKTELDAAKERNDEMGGSEVCPEAIVTRSHGSRREC